MKPYLLIPILFTSCATSRIYYPSGQLAAKVQGDVKWLKIGDISVEEINHSNVDKLYESNINAFAAALSAAYLLR